MERLFTIAGLDPKVQRGLAQRVRQSLKTLSHAPAGILLVRRPARMNRLSYLRFRILKRQFTGARTPGLPSAVKTGRLLARGLRRMKRGGKK
jgi:hypothetical protein